MKKLLIPTLLLCIANPMFAQNAKKKNAEIKTYFRVGVGYASSLNGNTRAPINMINNRQLLPANGSLNINNVSRTSYSETFDLKKSSFNAGIHGTVALGLMVNKHIGIELAGCIGISTKKVKTEISEADSGKNNTVALNVTQQAKLPLMVTPSIVLQTGGKVNIYSRAGIVLPIISRIVQEGAYTHDRFNPATSAYVRVNNTTWTEEYKMRLQPGFSGAIGAKYAISKNIQVWGELGIVSMSLYYKTSELTGYEYLDIDDGRISLSNIPPARRITQYEFKGTTTFNNTTYPTDQVSFSNCNITAGISIDLN